MHQFVLISSIHGYNSLQDYETDLATYTSGLETLLNIPIKRTMLRYPSTDLNQEVTALQWLLGCCDLRVTETTFSVLVMWICFL